MFIIEETVGVEERGGNGNSVIFAQFFWKLKILLKIKSIPLKKLNHCLFQKKKGGESFQVPIYTFNFNKKRPRRWYSENINGVPLLQKQYIKIRPDYNYFFSL